MVVVIARRQGVQRKHREAPLFQERELFLSHLEKRGVSHQQLCAKAGYLCQIPRILKMEVIRAVTLDEIQRGAEEWAASPRRQRGSRSGSTVYFRRIATEWFRFLGRLPEEPGLCYDHVLDIYVEEIRSRTCISYATAYGYRYRASYFLRWLMAARHGDLSKVTLHDVDAFISYQWSKKCCASTIVAYCQGLRSFFAYAEERGWCANRVAEGILSPRLSKYRSGHIAPTWVEVNKLLRLVQTRSALDLRAKAIILLLAIYGLRSSEVRDLRHSDFDWRSETFCVRRVKRGGMQQFPIQWKVGQAILRYLQYGRPEGDFPHLFLSTRKPYRPLGRGAMWEIIGPKMRRVGIETKHIGPHTLRHACASQLLKKGFSMHEIAEFLGHRDIRSVGIYARYDTRMLNRVAAFNLRGLL